MSQRGADHMHLTDGAETGATGLCGWRGGRSTPAQDHDLLKGWCADGGVICPACVSRMTTQVAFTASGKELQDRSVAILAEAEGQRLRAARIASGAESLMGFAVAFSAALLAQVAEKHRHDWRPNEPVAEDYSAA